MNTSTMDESANNASASMFFDLGKTSPKDTKSNDHHSNSNSMSLISLTNSVRASVTGGSPFPVVSSPCLVSKGEELKVSDLSHSASLQGLAKHVGHKEDHDEEAPTKQSRKKKTLSRGLSQRGGMGMSKAKSARELSPRRVSKSTRELSPRRVSHREYPSPRRESHRELSPRRESHRVQHQKSKSRHERSSLSISKAPRNSGDPTMRKERSFSTSPRKSHKAFDVAAAASMLKTPAAKQDKACEAAAFLLATPAPTTTRAASPDVESTRRHGGRSDNKEGTTSGRRRSSSHDGRRSTTTTKDSLDHKSNHVRRSTRDTSNSHCSDHKAAAAADRRRSKSEHRRSVLHSNKEDSLDRPSEHNRKIKRLPRRIHSDDGAADVDGGSEEFNKRERLRRRHHHSRRTQSHQEGSMTKPANVRARRIQSQPEGGALEEAAETVLKKAAASASSRQQQRVGRNLRGAGGAGGGPRSSGTGRNHNMAAQAMGNYQLQQILQQEISSALDVELADDPVVKFDHRPPVPPASLVSSPKIEEGMDLNTIDLTSLDAAAVNKLLAQSLHNSNNNNKAFATTTAANSNGAAVGAGTGSGGIVLPFIHGKDVKQQQATRRNRRGLSSRASGSNRHLTRRSTSKQRLSDLSDDSSDDEFA